MKLCNIPSIGFISSDMNPFFFDYFILVNNNTIENTIYYIKFLLSYIYIKFYEKNIFKFFYLLLNKKYKLLNLNK